MISSYLIILFASLAVFCSTMVISSRNPIHSILYLILVFCNITFVFIILGAEFIAITFLIVYVGAIAVLFLFVVMMLNIKIIELEENFWKYLPVGLFISFIFLFQIFFIFLKFTPFDFLDLFFYKNSYQLLQLNDSNFVLIKAASIVSFNSVIEITNTELLGWLIYTYQLPIFIVVSLILLVSMIGSIILVLNQNINIRRQIIFRQVLKDLKSSVSLKK